MVSLRHTSVSASSYIYTFLPRPSRPMHLFHIASFWFRVGCPVQVHNVILGVTGPVAPEMWKKFFLGIDVHLTRHLQLTERRRTAVRLPSANLPEQKG